MVDSEEGDGLMPGYEYRGSGPFDAANALKRKGVFDPTACGSRRGYKQHKRFREPACQQCLDACAEQMAEWRRDKTPAKPKPVFKPEKCGTVPGYSQHRHYGVPLCDACRQANIDDCKARRTDTKPQLKTGTTR